MFSSCLESIRNYASQKIELLCLMAIPFRHFILRRGTTKPLWPGSIIDGHIWFTTEICCQGNMAGCNPLATCGNQWLWKVHFLLLEHALDFFLGFLKSFLSQEVEERHIYGAWNVTWFYPWNKRKNNHSTKS